MSRSGKSIETERRWVVTGEKGEWKVIIGTGLGGGVMKMLWN